MTTDHPNLLSIADAITVQVTCGGNIFVFRDRAQLVGEIHTNRPPPDAALGVQTSWRVCPAVTRETVDFLSWSAAVLYLKALYLEAMVTNGPIVDLPPPFAR